MISYQKKRHTMTEVLSQMDPAIQKWFRSKFKDLTEPQAYAIPLIEAKNNVLISSPTGSGKTISAFLAIIDRLYKLHREGKLEDKIYCVYVSPLKALANDINRNLKEPLREIGEVVAQMGGERPPNYLNFPREDNPSLGTRSIRFQLTPGREAATRTAERGYLHCGPSGAGHFVKMVHNGIEYGIMQAYAEGFDIMKNATSTDLPEELRYDLNLADIAELWRRGSVVGSWLLDLTAQALAENPTLSRYTGFVQDSGEGRWTIMAAIEEGVPADVLSAALYVRFRSRQEHTFAEKVLSAMREKFGGHIEPPAGG